MSNSSSNVRAGTVMGLSNGFGSIAGIVVPLGKPSMNTSWPHQGVLSYSTYFIDESVADEEGGEDPAGVRARPVQTPPLVVLVVSVGGVTQAGPCLLLCPSHHVHQSDADVDPHPGNVLRQLVRNISSSSTYM